MKVIIINEDNHGMIGAVMTYDTAIEFLTRYNWLNGQCDVIDAKGNFTTLEQKLGKDWRDIILSWTVHRFNMEFEGLFNLELYGIYGTE